jgi:hypothetical protein
VIMVPDRAHMGRMLLHPLLLSSCSRRPPCALALVVACGYTGEVGEEVERPSAKLRASGVVMLGFHVPRLPIAGGS